jgi:hypothetical protein
MRAMGRWWKRVDERRMVAIILAENEDGEEREVEIPVEFEVCGTCEGKGKHVNPSIDSHGITEDEWGQWSPEEQETYLSGGYDVECYECSGKRVVPVPAESRMTDEQKTALEYATDFCWERLDDHRTQLMESGIHNP